MKCAFHPLVTIVTPTYNAERFIEETIQSVTSQTYQNWEMVVVDDGSTDNTIELVKKYTAQYKNIRLLCRDRLPKGGNTCRNIGLSNANGEYVIFLDADDVLNVDCLENRVRACEQYPEADFLVFQMGKMDVHGKRIEFKRYMCPQEKALEAFVSLYCIWQTTGPIWKREFLMILHGFDENLQRSQDVDLAFRALSLGKVNYRIFDDVDFLYRQETKELTPAFWERARVALDRYIQTVITWINTNSKSQYKVYLIRTIWDYVLYSWRANCTDYSNIEQYYLQNCLSSGQFILMKWLLTLPLKQTLGEKLIRLFKYLMSKKI